MSDEDLINKNMSWAIPYLLRLRQFTHDNMIDMKSFALNAITDKVTNSFVITGVDSINQLKENISLLNENIPSKQIFEDWWKNLPLYPEKLLNPSLWK